ncbi:MAG TPA: hypothetical protein VGB76_06805 [Pyrinomonadaceae bacterium]
MARQPANLVKQVTFALAQTLTGMVKEAQGEVISDIENTFTVRNNWDKPSNAMGIKALPATKQDLSAALVTRADWLIPHEEGEDKVPEGKALAVPSKNVRRTKRDIIQRSQRPKALRGKRDVVLPLKGGGQGLFQRKGRGTNSKLVFLYALAKRARIRKQPTVVEPTVKVVEKKFDKLFYANLKKALRTAR